MLVAHLRAVPDPDDDPVVEAHEPVDPAAAVAPGEADASVPDLAEGSSDLGADLGADLEDDEPRRYPSTIGGAFYLSILAAAGTALFHGASSDWRLGIEILGGSLVVAALLRLVLATRDAGMLAVRHRFVDVVLLSAAGVALILLASSIPDQPVS